MDKNIFDFWGQVLWNTARIQREMKNMSRYLRPDGYSENLLADVMFSNLWWQKPGKFDYEEVMEAAKKFIAVYKDIFNAYCGFFDVVSREEYFRKTKENEELKEKISEQEKIIKQYENMSGKDAGGKAQSADKMSRIMKSQTQQFQKLMEQINRYYRESMVVEKK